MYNRYNEFIGVFGSNYCVLETMFYHETRFKMVLEYVIIKVHLSLSYLKVIVFSKVKFLALKFNRAFVVCCGIGREENLRSVWFDKFGLY